MYKTSFYPLIKQAGAQIHYPTEWPSVMGHPFFVEQIWLNLLKNALTYCKGSPQIVVRIEHLPDQQMVRFSVQDNGIGLTEDQQALMFKAFPRIQTRNPNAGGLGLYTARTIVERFGGTISVESQYGRGSTFSFTLPTVDKPVDKSLVLS